MLRHQVQIAWLGKAGLKAEGQESTIYLPANSKSVLSFSMTLEGRRWCGFSRLRLPNANRSILAPRGISVTVRCIAKAPNRAVVTLVALQLFAGLAIEDVYPKI